MSIDVVANGRRVTVPDGETVDGIVVRLGLGAKWVVVERNGEPVPRSAFADVRLQAGDRLEVVRPVQGG